MAQLIEDIKYLKYVIFHPFDGFFEVKHRGKGNLYVATALIIIYGIMSIISYQYSGFIVNFGQLSKMNSISLFIMAIFPIVLFVISNWSSATLYNGKGRVKDIYMVMCYALLPMILFDLTTILLSNIIIMEEASLLYSFKSMGIVWFMYLAFSGLATVHEYSFKENIVILLATAVATIIIIFVVVLYISLMEQMGSFITTLIQELLRR